MKLKSCWTALALASLLATPHSAYASTTVSNVGGVEVIIAQPDALTPARPRTRRVRPSLRSAGPAVAAASASQPVGLARGNDLLHEGLALVGTPYRWGGTSPRGFDCSGFTYYLFARLGIRIPRTADAQFAAGRPIAGDPLPGDLVFFQTYDYGASHVGVYLGDGRFVNSIGPDVHVASFASPYFRSRYIGARRFLPG